MNINVYGSSGPRVGWGLLKDTPDVEVPYTPSEYSATHERLLKRAVTIEHQLYFPIAKDMLIKLDKRLVEMAIFGYRVIDGFKSNLKGFSSMMKDLESRISNGYIQSIDGGFLPVRSAHSVLNLVLQSTGSIAVKYWMVEVHKRLKASGLIEGKHYIQMAYIHDELDFRVITEHAHTVGQILSDSMKVVSEQLNLNVSLESEYMVGDSWYSCH